MIKYPTLYKPVCLFKAERIIFGKHSLIKSLEKQYILKENLRALLELYEHFVLVSAVVPGVKVAH